MPRQLSAWPCDATYFQPAGIHHFSLLVPTNACTACAVQKRGGGSYSFLTSNRAQANLVGYINRPVNEITAPGLYNIDYSVVSKRVLGPSFVAPSSRPSTAPSKLSSAGRTEPSTSEGGSQSSRSRVSAKMLPKPPSMLAEESSEIPNDLELHGVQPKHIHSRR